MEEEFIFGDAERVGLSEAVLSNMKLSLAFEPKSEFFLRVPDKAQLYIVILCLIGKDQRLTKNLNRAISTLEAGYQQTIKQDYLRQNLKKEKFDAVEDLQKLSNTLNYNIKLFRQCSAAFNELLIEYVVSVFKKQEKVRFRYFGNKNDEFGQVNKEEEAQQALLLMEQPDARSIIIAAFSKKPSPRGIEKQIEKVQKTEEIEQEKAKKEELRKDSLILPQESVKPKKKASGKVNLNPTQQKSPTKKVELYPSAGQYTSSKKVSKGRGKKSEANKQSPVKKIEEPVQESRLGKDAEMEPPMQADKTEGQSSVRIICCVALVVIIVILILSEYNYIPLISSLERTFSENMFLTPMFDFLLGGSEYK